MKIGSIVVYSPPGTSFSAPYKGRPRYVVLSDPDFDGYVWIAELGDPPDKSGKPDVSIEYTGDLTVDYNYV